MRGALHLRPGLGFASLVRQISRVRTRPGQRTKPAVVSPIAGRTGHFARGENLP